MRVHIKQIAAVLISAALVVILLLSFALPASAADVYFTAVNNTILDLRYETMPVSIGGTIYVHYRDFSAKDANGGGLGIYVNYSPTSSIVQLIKDDKELRFDLSASKTYDQDGKEYSFKAVFRKGEIFLPVSDSCSFLDVNYSYIVNKDGNVIIRLYTGSVLPNSDFADSKVASDRMSALLDKYLRENANTPTPPLPVSTPYVPPYTPPPTITPSQKPGYEHVEVYLAFYGVGHGYGSAALKTLDSYGYKACFFLSAQEIAENAELVREILGTGHNVGLYSENGIKSDYVNTARTLRSAANIKTLLSASGSIEDISALCSELGLLLWFDGNAAIMDSAEAFEDFSVLTGTLDETNETRLDLIIRLGEDTSAALDALLSELKDGGFTVKCPRETAAPYSAER